MDFTDDLEKSPQHFFQNIEGFFKFKKTILTLFLLSELKPYSPFQPLSQPPK